MSKLLVKQVRAFCVELAGFEESEELLDSGRGHDLLGKRCVLCGKIMKAPWLIEEVGEALVRQALRLEEGEDIVDHCKGLTLEVRVAGLL